MQLEAKPQASDRVEVWTKLPGPRPNKLGVDVITTRWPVPCVRPHFLGLADDSSPAEAPRGRGWPIHPRPPARAWGCLDP